jgi:RNA polymerase sigma-70 factor (ECF subfamily)
VDDESAAFAYVRTRDAELFRVLVERHQHRVFRLVSSLLGPHADLDAQEVTQEVFLRACQRLHTFRGDSRFSTWLYRLAYNRTLEHRRHARITSPHVSIEVIRELAADPCNEQLEHEREQFVEGLLERLPDLYRTVINMRYWLEYSIEEMSEALAVPAGTVKSYLFRAREQLREQAKLQGIELPE